MNNSKRGLQIVIVLLSLLPLGFGLMGVVFGAARFQGAGPALPVDLDNQMRFLSAWYLALAVLAWWVAATIERQGTLFRIICWALFAGGLARLISVVTVGPPSTRFLVVMAAELLFPLLIVWQNQVRKTGWPAA
jgi:hypothetical protein